MIFLVVTRVDIAVAIGGHLFFLEGISVIGRRSDRLGVASDTNGFIDIVLGDAAINGAWRELAVRKIACERLAREGE